MRVGIEIGGTFTDLIAIHARGVSICKVPSTPDAPEIGFGNALAGAGIAASEISELVHGSTVATNAVLERKGARVALVTTAGFRDLLWIQRQDKNKSYDLRYRKPAPAMSRRDVVEVRERIDAKGRVVTPLDENEALEVLAWRLDQIRPEIVAVSLLNAYANPAHERALVDYIGRVAPNLEVVCSHATSSEFREYERTSTTVLSAFLKPVVGRYLGRIRDGLARDGFVGQLSVMQSNGGRLPANAMEQQPITALLSGPAAGTIGAARVAVAIGFPNVITFDMGGTSADVSLVTDGRTALKSMTRVDDLPVRTPVLDISTVGAGGGSIVWRDEGGMLRVGPESSGAFPGPACYGRGGTTPTITDAHVLRGTLRTDRSLAGGLALDAEAARRAFESLASAFGCTAEEMADSAIRVATANIVAAIRGVSTAVGRDPRDYALLAFGGAGPLHAGRVAEELGINDVIVPANAGVLSAVGLLSSSYEVFETATRRITLDDSGVAQVRETFASLSEAAERRLVDAGVPGPYSIRMLLLMRYVGQAFEIDVAVPPDELATAVPETLRGWFEDASSRQFQRQPSTTRAVEIVGFRCGASADPPEEVIAPGATPVSPDPDQEATVYEERQNRPCTILAWPSADRSVTGAAVIDATTSTVFVPPGWHASVEPLGGCLLLRRNGIARPEPLP